MRIKKLVSRLVRKYQTRDPFEMIKGMNVILVHYPLEGVRGFYQYFQRNHIIYLDERLTEAEQRFVLAHELGHILLHSREIKTFQETETTLYETNRLETEANRFAAELLLGDSASFYREMQDSDYTLFQIAAVHHVPYDFLAYKLQMMEEEGYPVPELPAEPDSRCLGGDLGLPDCYGFYEE